MVNDLESYVDIKTRDGLGRVGVWSINGNSIEIPAIANIVSARLPVWQPSNHRYEMEITDLATLSGKLSSGNSKKGLKLHLYHAPNPLTTAIDENIHSSNLFNPHLVIPGTLIYPECFAADGISLESILDTDEVLTGAPASTPAEVQLISRDNEMLHPPTKLVILLNALKLLAGPRALVSRVLSIKSRHEPNKVLYLPGSATPNNLAILVYLGVDIFDTLQCILHARARNLMTNSGMVPLAELEKVGSICSCEGCTALRNDEHQFENVFKHNVITLFSELALVKTMIYQGRLRELVEQRMVTEPGLTSIVRIMDLEYYESLEQFFPVYGIAHPMTCTHESLNRPEIRRFRERIMERYAKPASARILVFLPCSARKPYSTSKSHKLFQHALYDSCKNPNQLSALHEVIITSPLGLVPRELELVYPAQQYDIPVTGHWFEDELKMIKECINSYLIKNQYEHILIHLNGSMGKFIQSCILDILSNSNSSSGGKVNVVLTSPEHPTTKGSLNKLSAELKTIFENHSAQNPTDIKRRHVEDLQSIAQYQFGAPGVELVSGCKVKGRYPNLKLFKDGTQVGMLTGERGLISLTLTGGGILADLPEFEYEIKIDDFKPKGSVLAVGVLEANRIIRIGDEVIACFNDELRAVGQSVMSGTEMEKSTRGVAVKVRHHI
ncbi:archaeosine synthase subunit alpha [[Eubacterium] cellulosolvens]